MWVLRRKLHSAVEEAALVKHRYKGWGEERKSKLTASTLKNALGFRRGSRVALWKEKVGLAKPFNGCPATWWTNLYEETALDKYKEITGNDVSLTGFHVYEKNRDDWLAASPDGLIEGQSGVLEIKCPFNCLAETADKDKMAFPWAAVPAVCMPQAQGLLEILDRDWLDFFVWTPRGSSLFRINRDPQYWALIFPQLLHGSLAVHVCLSRNLILEVSCIKHWTMDEYFLSLELEDRTP
ncbi:hypothetical protein SUGI_0278220 [Cryptomeria japonica]|nr:hypothetical protein SUGI_0278220 [Cryptomeria japonica]